MISHNDKVTSQLIDIIGDRSKVRAKELWVYVLSYKQKPLAATRGVSISD